MVLLSVSFQSLDRGNVQPQCVFEEMKTTGRFRSALGNTWKRLFWIVIGNTGSFRMDSGCQSKGHLATLGIG